MARFIGTKYPLIVLAALALTASAQADEGSPSANEAQPVSVEGLKKKYWAKGTEGETRVVQNRLYSKTSKFELAPFVGNVSNDPFLSIKNYGLRANYFLSESIALGGVFWKASVSPSSALTTLEEDQNVTANTNKPDYYYGAELTWNPIYGKLSLLGERIIYFDLYLCGGLGQIKTETGTYLSPSLGLGQLIYLSQRFALRLDYRLMRYTEDIAQKTYGSTELGPILKSQTSWTDVITLGFSFFLG